MTAEKIDEFLHRRPFEPFRIHMSDGSSYEVRHLELALLTRREVFVAEPPRTGKYPTRTAICDLLHVTRIEPSSDEKPKSRRNGH